MSVDELKKPVTQFVVLSSRLLLGDCLSLGYECFFALLDDSGHLSFQSVIQNFLLHDGAQKTGIGGVDEAVELGLEVAYLIDRQVVKETAGAGINDQNLLGERQGRKLLLL